MGGFDLKLRHYNLKLQENQLHLEIAQKTKLLGVHLTDDLKWNETTMELVKKANSRMILLRKVVSFGASFDDMKKIYIFYIRSIFEQSCVVWHSSLTEESSQDLEKIQKSAVRMIIGEHYTNYKDGLAKIDLEELSERRESIFLKLAKKCLKNDSKILDGIAGKIRPY